MAPERARLTHRDREVSPTVSRPEVSPTVLHRDREVSPTGTVRGGQAPALRYLACIETGRARLRGGRFIAPALQTKLFNLFSDSFVEFALGSVFDALLPNFLPLFFLPTEEELGLGLHHFFGEMSRSAAR